MKKRILALALAAAVSASVLAPLAGCADGLELLGDGTRELAQLELAPITYSKSETVQNENDTYIIVHMPADTNVQTGEEFEVRTRISSQFTFASGEGEIYYVVDWGDGTWSYNGPALQDTDYRSVVTHKHVYTSAGEFQIRAAAFSMTSEAMIGWSRAYPVNVSGDAYAYPDMIKKAEAISSDTAGKGYSSSNILDGDSSTYFKSAVSENDDIDAKKYVGLLFDRNYVMDMLEIQIPAEADVFPSNINIEYTTDFGETWFSFPKYYYLYPYMEGRFNPIMNFPNPKGATLVLYLDGMCANGIRISSELWPVYGADVGKEKALYVSEMRAYGNERMLFYSSNDDTYNADLNNMWTIYGSANTEPLVVGSMKGETTNANPFRSGFKIIAVTEWLDWQSQKFSWTGLEAENAVMLENLKEVTVAGDGWSDYPGYVWADRDYPQHFNVQNHYQYNAIFIMGAANYILSGNYNTLLDINNNRVSIFDIKNKSGETLWYRIQKAMYYQLEILHGKTGVLTIDDPDNQGLRDSVASSYMDEYNFDGYLSVACNLYFYESLLAMAELYDYHAVQMNESGAAEQAQYYRQLAALSKQKINEMFWNSQTGRFIMSIDVNGRRFDMGATYINTMASAFGIADPDKGQSIYDWLDGKRIVESDLSSTGGSTGEDIYYYKIAPRTNTVDIYNLSEGGSGTAYWWTHDGLITTDPGAWAGWGNNQMNGGYFLWNSAYDIQGRASYLGADNAFERFNVIMEEFGIDQLRRYSFSNNGEDAGYIEGTIGEYPESGMVPLTFLNTFIGMNTSGRGLVIEPNLPGSLSYAGVRSYFFGGREYSVYVGRDVASPVVEKYGDVYYVKLPASGSYTITYDNRLVANN